jgi:hypothetical protein
MAAYNSDQNTTTGPEEPTPLGEISNIGPVTGKVDTYHRISTGRTKANAGNAKTITAEIVAIGTRSNSYLENYIQRMDDTPCGNTGRTSPSEYVFEAAGTTLHE